MRYVLVAALFAFMLLQVFSWVRAQGDADGQNNFPVILDLAMQSHPETPDPQLVEQRFDRTVVENLFVGLTDLNPFTGEITPELASSWEVNEEATVWTFYLRDDVNWVRYDAANEAAEVTRPVMVGDVVYGIQRACDPRLNRVLEFNYESVVNLIQGCREVFDNPNADDALVHGDVIGVAALDDVTVQIELTEPAGYFLSMTILPVLRPVYRDAIEEYGEDWIEADNIITSGPYLLAATNDMRLAFVRNGAYPDELWHDGNIDRVYFTLIGDDGTIYSLMEEHFFDKSPVPRHEMTVILDPEFASQIKLEDPVVFYFGFDHSQPPFNNVHVRRAFSTIVDRELFVNEVLRGRGASIEQLTDIDLFNTKNASDVGVGIDTTYAREQMQLAGYSNCEGFPDIEISTYSAAGEWAEFWAEAAKDYLGCDISNWEIWSLEFGLVRCDVPPCTAYNEQAFTYGWGPVFPDFYDFYKTTTIACDSELELPEVSESEVQRVIDANLYRSCSRIDDWIEDLAPLTDPAKRIHADSQINDALFGPDGEHPIVLLYNQTNFYFVKDWYTGPFEAEVAYWGQHWDAYSVDMATKLAAREN